MASTIRFPDVDRAVAYARAVLDRRHKGLDNRAENSHQPTRKWERQMKRFQPPKQVQRFLSAHNQIDNLFPLRRDYLPALRYRATRTQAFQTWTEVTGVAALAQPSVRPAEPRRRLDESQLS